MPRRSRSKGAGKGSGKPHRLPAQSRGLPAVEEALDRLGVAMLAGDPDLLEQVADELENTPPNLPDIIANRLIDNREPAPDVMLRALNETAGERLPAVLARIAKARGAPDLTRFEA